MDEAVRMTIQAMDAAGAKRTQNEGPRLDRPIMKQPTLNWVAEDKYYELKNFKLEVNSIFKSYNMPHAEQILIITRMLISIVSHAYNV